jgi:hypothetical protein
MRICLTMETDAMSRVQPSTKAEWLKTFRWLRAGMVIGTVGGLGYVALLYFGSLDTEDEATWFEAAVVTCIYLPLFQLADTLTASALFVAIAFIKFLKSACSPDAG